MTLGFVPDAKAPAPTPKTGTTPDGGTGSGNNLQFIPDPVPEGWGGWALRNAEAGAEAGGKLLARTGVRLATALPNLLVGGSQAIGAGAEKLGVPLVQTPELGPLDTWLSKLGIPEHTGNLYDNGQQLTGQGAPAQPMPSEDLINKLHLQMDPNASTAMKVADYVAPFVLGGLRGGVNRVSEASGLVNKTAQGLGYLTGAGLDAAGNYVGSDIGQYIGGPTGAFVGSLFGGGVRPLVQRGVGYAGQKTYGAPEGGDVFDAMTSQQGPNAFPTFGQVTGNEGKQFEKGVGSIPILKSGVQAARDTAEQGMANSVATGVSELGDRAPSLGPVGKDVTGTNIIGAARDTNLRLGEERSAEQQALEDAIGTNRPTNVSPLVETMSRLSNDSAAPIQRVVAPRTADLYKSLNAGPAGPEDLTAPYGHLKVLRTDLGEKTVATDPMKGPPLIEARQGYTDAMRQAAHEADQGPEFDAANQRYTAWKKVQEPWLDLQGGRLESGAPQVHPGPIAGRADAMVGTDPGYLATTHELLGEPVARSALADVLSRQGRISERFTPSQWAKDYGSVNDPAKAYIAAHAPAAVPYFENAATGGRAFDLAPERPGQSNAMGGVAATAALLAKYPRLAVALAGGMETPSVIRAMAGRTDIPAVVAQYLLRQGAAQR
jgi:hypothetical protein